MDLVPLSIVVSESNPSISATLFLAALGMLAGFVKLVERRGRDHRELNPHRQIEIGTLLESMPEAVLIFDLDGRTIEANSAAERLFRVNRSGLKKFTAEDLAKLLTEPAARGDEGVVNRVLSGEAIQQERMAFSVPGGIGKMETIVSANPIRDPVGRLVGGLVVFRDITELAVLQKRIGETERHHAIGKMAAGLAHDFSNVLDTISQAVSVIELDGSRSQEERQMILRMIRNAVRRGSEIIAGVREYLLGGKQNSDRVDLNEILEDSIELTRPLWQAAKNVSIQRLFQPVSPVRANAIELRRVFTNLVINAIEAMPSGGTLTVGCEERARKVRAFVADTGEGIPEDKKRHIFSPYFTTKEGGTGLGLSSAERAVHAQAGEISFESKKGQGTRFNVEFQAEQADVPQSA